MTRFMNQSESTVYCRISTVALKLRLGLIRTERADIGLESVELCSVLLNGYGGLVDDCLCLAKLNFMTSRLVLRPSTQKFLKCCKCEKFSTHTFHLLLDGCACVSGRNPSPPPPPPPGCLIPTNPFDHSFFSDVIALIVCIVLRLLVYSSPPPGNFLKRDHGAN